MTKRIVIAGCRNYSNYNLAKEFIETCISDMPPQTKIIIISGGCKGADTLGERFAKENGYEIEKYPAQWNKYGRAAGPKRNRIMAEKCDLVICFWDGKSKGTKSMIDCARELDKPVNIKYIEYQ